MWGPIEPNQYEPGVKPLTMGFIDGYQMFNHLYCISDIMAAGLTAAIIPVGSNSDAREYLYHQNESEWRVTKYLIILHCRIRTGHYTTFTTVSQSRYTTAYLWVVDSSYEICILSKLRFCRLLAPWDWLLIHTLLFFCSELWDCRVLVRRGHLCCLGRGCSYWVMCSLWGWS